MKKVELIIAIIIIPFILTCCVPRLSGTGSSINAPKNKLIPLSGEWKIERFKPGSYSILSENEAARLLGESALFHEKVAILSSDSCIDPLYKIKNVDSSDYLLYQYKVNPDYLGITEPTIQVVTVSSKNQFFNEFIKTGNSQIIVNIDGTFFFLDKVSDTIDENFIQRYYENFKDNVEQDSSKYKDTVYSGVLIGLRSYEKVSSTSSNKQPVYRTLWIPGRNREVGKIYETEGLFVPRKTGFWKVNVKQEGYTRDMLLAYPADKDMYKRQNNNEPLNDAELVVKGKTGVNTSILYVGNDYVSIESVQESNPSRGALLQVLPLDNIENAKTIKISDIAGEAGRLALIEGAAKYFQINPKDETKFLNIVPDEESFGVARRNGHWIMKGRLNSIYDKDTFIDFNIKIIPPSSLVVYDELCLSWSAVKEKIPEAVDVYTSPNCDIAIIVTNNSLLVYSVRGSELSQNPLRKIKLKDKETIVMSEWASGRYTDKWEKEFLKNEHREINE